MNKTTILLLIILVLVVPSISATDYYYNQSGGNDVNDCSLSTPCKTIVDLNTKSLVAGDNIYFARNEYWRSPEDAYINFSSGNYTNGRITFNSYGLGDKPEILGSLDGDNISRWNNDSTYIWAFSIPITIDDLGVGNIIFNDNSTGIQETTYSNLNAQGDFYLNDSSNTLYFYSSVNPANYYDGIEIALYQNVLDLLTKDYINIYNISVKYGGKHGIAGYNNNQVTIDNVSVKYIGGGGTTARLGNCITLELSCANVTISHNIVGECYDAGISAQGYSAGTYITDNQYSYNVIYNSGYGLEFFNNNLPSTFNNILISHNTVVNSGRGWSEPYIDYGRAVRMAKNYGTTINVTLTDNIFYNSKQYDMSKASSWNGTPSLNYNLYNISGTGKINWNDVLYDTLLEFQTAISQESNGLDANPLLISGTYQPSIGSPACNMSSTGGYVGALPCQTTISCKPYKEISCVKGICSYNGSVCSEESLYRENTIVCVRGSCT